MRPITFTCTQVLARPAAAIAGDIAELSRWSEFKGHGFLPGIQRAVYEQRPEGMEGARIRVQNTDGSGHVEEVLVWNPGQQIVMKLCEFTPPLSRLATHFIEEWHFAPTVDGTHISRQLSLFPQNRFVRPLLWLISRLLKRAIASHLQSMAIEAASPSQTE